MFKTQPCSHCRLLAAGQASQVRWQGRLHSSSVHLQGLMWPFFLDTHASQLAGIHGSGSTAVGAPWKQGPEQQGPEQQGPEQQGPEQQGQAWQQGSGSRS
jgi:hypothetical protein